jgi:hypothetical protein
MVAEMFVRANGKCEVTRIPFSFLKMDGSRKRPWYPSIDRINSLQGYSFSNCRLVCIAVNLAMHQWGESVLHVIGDAMAEIKESQRSTAERNISEEVLSKGRLEALFGLPGGSINGLSLLKDFPQPINQEMMPSNGRPTRYWSSLEVLAFLKEHSVPYSLTTVQPIKTTDSVSSYFSQEADVVLRQLAESQKEVDKLRFQMAKMQREKTEAESKAQRLLASHEKLGKIMTLIN